MKSTGRHSHAERDIKDLDTRQFSCREGYPHAQKRAHWHSEIEINLLTKGRITYLWHDQLLTLEKKTMTLFWAGMPHQVIHAQEGSHCYWVYIPLAWFLQWRLPETFTQTVLGGKMTMLSVTSHFSGEIAKVRQWCEDMDRHLPDLNDIVLLEIEAQVRRLALQFVPERGNPEPGPARMPTGPTKCIEAMTRLMARKYREPITLSDIAMAAGLHPNYACSLFSRVCGISLRTYLNHLRISHAQRLLATTDMKVLDVALDAGFGSLSRFYAAFESACRCTPRAYREMVSLPR